MDGPEDLLACAGRVLHRSGLISVFGYVPVRAGEASFLITPAEPLGSATRVSNFSSECRKLCPDRLRRTASLEFLNRSRAKRQ